MEFKDPVTIEGLRHARNVLHGQLEKTRARAASLKAALDNAHEKIKLLEKEVADLKASKVISPPSE